MAMKQEIDRALQELKDCIGLLEDAVDAIEVSRAAMRDARAVIDAMAYEVAELSKDA